MASVPVTLFPGWTMRQRCPACFRPRRDAAARAPLLPGAALLRACPAPAPGAPAQMRIVVPRATIRNLAHAGLVVYPEGEAYAPDGPDDVAQPHGRPRHCDPPYSVNENGRRTHIRPRPAGAGGPREKRQ